MKKKLLFPLLLLSCVVWGQSADTIHVISHDKTVVVTDPATGSKAYRSWAVFPSAQTPIRRINLKVNFGCPDSMRCADWDYLDHIIIRRKGGVNSASLDYPIGRMLTPYGGAFAKDWTFEWDTEITDFSLLLRDSVEIEYLHTGYEPAQDRGWKITVDFEIIKGVPVREPVSITKLYDAHFAYGDSSNPIDKQLQPVPFTTAKNGSSARLLIFQTGHGMDVNGCGEFCSRYREVWFDGKMIDKRDIWKACGENPLYPQAGTWVYDRANWCPGYLQHPDVFELALRNGQQHIVNIAMQPYVTATPSATEVITAYLVQYRPVVKKPHASIEDIVVPTNKQVHQRQNPSSIQPVVVIRNLGASPLRKCVIEYGTGGFKKKSYLWKGNLAFNNVDTVYLPGTIDAKPGINNFYVAVSGAKGQRVAADARRETVFTKVPVLGKKITINLYTNKEPGDNSYEIKNSGGGIIYERKQGTLQAETAYKDTLQLQPGSYAFTLKDTGNNGLEFWANSRGGRGFVYLTDEKGNLVKSFDSDFGSSIYYGFEVSDDTTRLSPPEEKPVVGVFPTRTKGKTTLDYFGNNSQKVIVQLVTDPGNEVVEEHTYSSLKEGVYTYDLSYRPAQRYFIKVYVGPKLVYNKRLRVGE